MQTRKKRKKNPFGVKDKGVCVYITDRGNSSQKMSTFDINVSQKLKNWLIYSCTDGRLRFPAFPGSGSALRCITGHVHSQPEPPINHNQPVSGGKLENTHQERRN